MKVLEYSKQHVSLPVAGAMLVSFLIPVYNNLVPAALGVLFVVTLVYFKKYYSQFKFQWGLVSLGLLYLAYTVGMIFTSYTSDGWSVMERKLSLLLVPIYFLFFRPFNSKQLYIILSTFVAGCLFYSLVTFINSYIHYRGDGDTDWFYSQKISSRIHPTYMALYVNFAVLCLAYGLVAYRKQMGWIIKTCLIFLMIWFSLYILLLASKGGILGLAISWMAIVMFYFYSIGRWYFGVIAVVVSLSGLIYAIRYPTVTRWKFQKATEIYYMPIDSVLLLYKESTESNAVRRMVWHVSWQSVQNNPWGYGTGDSKNFLYSEYERRGITGAFERKLNCHNQYLETTMAVGIPGLLLLLLWLLSSVWTGFRHKKFILSWLGIVVLVNMLFESMLETQAGVIFLAYFISLLIAVPGKPSTE